MLEKNYIQSLKDLINNGIKSTDRTGIGTLRLINAPVFNIKENIIPILKGKFISPYNSFTELIWILTGRNDLKWLKDNGVNYWDSWVKDDGTFGPIYGTQMRSFNGQIDQYFNAIKLLINSPDSRRIICSLWNPIQQKDMALDPCHCWYQFISINNKLHLKVYQRSVDSFIGLGYDFMLFYYMLHISAYLSNHEIGEIFTYFGDYHMYLNQFDSVNKYINNFENNPLNKNLNVEIYFKLQYPEKPADLTSETLTEWLYKFYELNKNFETNYSDKSNRYGLIKTDVAV